MKRLITMTRRILNKFGIDVIRISYKATGDQRPQIPDVEYYRPLFSPWLGYGDFKKYYELAKKGTLVSPDRCWVLYSLCRQSLSIGGDIWECGVYKGGTASMIAQLIKDFAPDRRLHLFDTFEGMPETDSSIDIHKKGDFSDTALESVKAYIKNEEVVIYHKGFIPDTFIGMEQAQIAFAHVDVDIKQSVLDCCAFIFPRLALGGFLIFDDYGFPSCPGARQAVDAYFSDKDAIPLILTTGQAIIFKSKS